MADGWDCHVHVFDAARPVAAGHYQPGHHPLTDIEEVARAHGIGHLVLAQPSVYGSDNSLLLEALRAHRGRHRGVVVLDDCVDDAALDVMHVAGVRGIRFNLVSPVGERTVRGGSLPAELEARIDAWAPRLSRLGWHVQWYAKAEHLEAIARVHARLHARHTAVTAVLDHLAGLRADVGAAHSCLRALDELAALSAWVKLSGWYRLGAHAPYDALAHHVRHLCERFASRLVWGSDWPHTGLTGEAMPSYAATWQPVVDVLGEASARRLRERLPSIYA